MKWKTTVKAAIKTTYKRVLKEKLITSKLKDGPLVGENFEKKDYILSMKLCDARTNFRRRSNTTNVKMTQATLLSYGNAMGAAASTLSATSFF